MSTLHDLYRAQGQSPWIDDLRRSYLTTGHLEELVASGIRGLTSNPTIIAKAIEAGSDYDEDFAACIAAGLGVEDIFWELAIADVTGALATFGPLYDESDGRDGYVSLEVAPSLAHETQATIAAASELHGRIDKPNLLVKIPATKAGIPAIEETIASGKSVNVTLIFSLERYGEVIDAYQSGLERLVASGGDPTRVASVASFFVSRVDTEVDRRLEELAAASPGSPIATRALELSGRAAVAQARLAYRLFEERFGSDRFRALAGRGARRQRPLWASTSTKNPAYPDLLYVEQLVGPETVDTMPEPTVRAFLDHGVVERRVDAELDRAEADLAGLGELGVDIDDVTATLEREGVASFASSFDGLIESLSSKAEAFRAGTASARR